MNWKMMRKKKKKNINFMVVNTFKKKSLNSPPERVCLRLKKLRLEQNKTIEEISQKTKIDKKYLKALEECRFKDLPSTTIYQKNILKSYIETLGLESEPFLKQYFLEENILKKKSTQKKNKQNWLYRLPDIIKYGTLFFLILVLIFYLVWQVKKIVDPPGLIIYSPQDGLITNQIQLVVTGLTDKGAFISLNGKNITHNEEGKFEEVLDLQEGVNTITIIAKKKHGKTITETRNVVLKN